MVNSDSYALKVSPRWMQCLIASKNDATSSQMIACDKFIVVAPCCCLVGTFTLSHSLIMCQVFF